MGERLRRCRLETPICLDIYLAIGSQDTNVDPTTCELLGIFRPVIYLLPSSVDYYLSLPVNTSVRAVATDRNSSNFY
jgi:hypothetical protein